MVCFTQSEFNYTNEERNYKHKLIAKYFHGVGATATVGGKKFKGDISLEWLDSLPMAPEGEKMFVKTDRFWSELCCIRPLPEFKAAVVENKAVVAETKTGAVEETKMEAVETKTGAVEENKTVAVDVKGDKMIQDTANTIDSVISSRLGLGGAEVMTSGSFGYVEKNDVAPSGFAGISLSGLAAAIVNKAPKSPSEGKEEKRVMPTWEQVLAAFDRIKETKDITRKYVSKSSEVKFIIIVLKDRFSLIITASKISDFNLCILDPDDGFIDMMFPSLVTEDLNEHFKIWKERLDKSGGETWNDPVIVQ